MLILTLALEAEIHREVYTAILHSALKTPGSKRSLATALGISPQYLSYICDPTNTYARDPSPKLIEKLVQYPTT
jgi:hypothetical protein